MTRINRAASGLTLALALTVGAGCSDNISLIGRDTLPGRSSQPVQDEIVATVEQVDFQRNSFEIRELSRERVLVSLPYNARRSDVDHFRALRVGDYVRAEGRFLDRERFELENFLRENR